MSSNFPTERNFKRKKRKKKNKNLYTVQKNTITSNSSNFSYISSSTSINTEDRNRRNISVTFADPPISSINVPIKSTSLTIHADSADNALKIKPKDMKTSRNSATFLAPTVSEMMRNSALSFGNDSIDSYLPTTDLTGTNMSSWDILTRPSSYSESVLSSSLDLKRVCIPSFKKNRIQNNTQ